MPANGFGADAVESTMDAGKYLEYANYLNWIPRAWSEAQLKAGRTAEQILDEGLTSGGNTLDALKDELSADARGNRHLESRPFWQSVMNELGQQDVGLLQKFKNIVSLASNRLTGSGYAVDKLFSNLPEIRQLAAQTEARFIERNLAQRANARQTDGQKVTFEIAPDPRNAELTNQWNALEQNAKNAISEQVARHVVARTLADFHDPAMRGDLRMQLGGWEDHTNPSLSVRFPAEVPSDKIDLFTRKLGYALDQMSMLRTAPTPFDGSQKMGTVVIKFDKPLSPDQIHNLYQQIRGIVDKSDKPYVSGHTTDPQQGMVILNDGTRIETPELARRIGDLLDGRFDVISSKIHTSFPKKGEDDYGLSGRTQSGGVSAEPSFRASASQLRAEARDLIGQLVRRAGKSGSGPGQPGSGRFSPDRERAERTESAERAAARPVPDAGRIRGSAGLLAEPRRADTGSGQAGDLIGLPTVVRVDGRPTEFHAFPPAQRAAESYARAAGFDYTPPVHYVKADPARGKLIADAYAAMVHDPHNPSVRAAYDALVRETRAQYDALMKTGLKVDFIDYAKQGDPYGNPRHAIADVVRNNHLWVFPTADGFGSSDFDPASHPLLAPTDVKINGRPALANDLFRVVHDYFGHVKEGVGFRADGEENAWRSHAAMFSPEARKALTSETRGQNSWVNFGPHGEFNRTASGAATIYADQKAGLLPEWIVHDGRTDGPGDIRFSPAREEITRTPEFRKWFGNSKVVDEQGNPQVAYHGTVSDISKFKRGTADAMFFTTDPEFANSFSARNNQDMWGRPADQDALHPNVLPVYLRAQHPFDFSSADDRSELIDRLFRSTSTYLMGNGERALVLDGEKTLYTREVLDAALAGHDNWELIERPEIQHAIHKLGRDSFYVDENGHKNIGVFSPDQIKSATGNNGRFDLGNPDIRFSSEREQRIEVLRDKLASFLDAPKSALSSLKIALVPMAAGTDEARVVARNFATEVRKTDYQWHQFDQLLTKRFSPEQRQKMWEAADEENDLRRDGITDPNRGLNRLSQQERQAVDMLHAYGEELMLRARDAGMFEGQGVPYWTPRMAVMIDGNGDIARMPGRGDGGSATIGRNLTTSAGSLKQRKYLTAEETEAAASALAQEKGGATALLVRDIRTMPLAMARIERAIAGRELINQVKALGELTGRDLVSAGAANGSDGYFTLDHPAFSSWRPDFVDGKVRLDADGNPVMIRVPMKVAKDFEGPLKAVLSAPPNRLYSALMNLKAKQMSLIMMSPMIHNMVIWSRAFPAMDWKGKLSLGAYTYVAGHRARQDPAAMREAIDGGLVPIGRNGAYTDITGIMQEPNLTPGRSWTAKLLAAPVSIISEPAANKVKAAVDAAGDFWHQTLLWDRVADVQMGLYTSMRASAINKGLSVEDASRYAAHFANRYAGALPREAMSEGARRFLNVVLFSRSFTMGNLGAMKDMIAGLPKDVQAQIQASGGDIALAKAQRMARGKAIGTFVTDIALSYVVNSMLQDWLAHEFGDTSWYKLAAAYRQRYGALADKLFADPVSVLTHPFASIASLTPMNDNEPGKEKRVLWGPESSGRMMYVRPPTGKIGEEFENYVSFPAGTLHQLHDKLSPFVRPLVDIANNDNGIGQPVFDTTHDASLMKNLGRIVTHIMAAQIPSSQLSSGYRLMTGKNDEMDAKRLWGPLVGLTFSQGHPGGPEAGIAAAARREYEQRLALTMPDVKQAIRDGRREQAEQMLTEIGVPPKEAGKILNRQENPRTGLSRSARSYFYRHATEEQKARMDRAGIN